MPKKTVIGDAENSERSSRTHEAVDWWYVGGKIATGIVALSMTVWICVYIAVTPNTPPGEVLLPDSDDAYPDPAHPNRPDINRFVVVSVRDGKLGQVVVTASGCWYGNAGSGNNSHPSSEIFPSESKTGQEHYATLGAAALSERVIQNPYYGEIMGAACERRFDGTLPFAGMFAKPDQITTASLPLEGAVYRWNPETHRLDAIFTPDDSPATTLSNVRALP